MSAPVEPAALNTEVSMADAKTERVEVHVRFTETPSKGDLLTRCQCLAAQVNDAMFIQSALNDRKICVVEVGSEVETSNFCTGSAAGGLDIDGHGRNLTGSFMFA